MSEGLLCRLDWTMRRKNCEQFAVCLQVCGRSSKELRANEGSDLDSVRFSKQDVQVGRLSRRICMVYMGSLQKQRCRFDVSVENVGRRATSMENFICLQDRFLGVA